MCGIAGLFLKDRQLEPELGAMLAGMLSPLNDRGPDSAGFAVYGVEAPGHLKFTLRVPRHFDLDRLLKSLRDFAGTPIAHRSHGTHIVLSVPADRVPLVRQALEAFADVAELAARCRFRDCGHGSEPGCVVRQALEQGGLDPVRLESWRKLTGEIAGRRRRR